MHETSEDLATLAHVLDVACESAGTHLRSIFTEERRIGASDLVRVLRGVCILDLATVSSRGEPIVAPVDRLFFRGRFWFGSAQNSDGSNSRRYTSHARSRANGLIKCAYENGNPKCAAIFAPSSVEPSIHSSGAWLTWGAGLTLARASVYGGLFARKAFRSAIFAGMYSTPICEP